MPTHKSTDATQAAPVARVRLIAGTYDPAALVENLLNLCFDEEVTVTYFKAPHGWQTGAPGASLHALREWLEVNRLQVVAIELRRTRRAGGWQGEYALKIGRIGETQPFTAYDLAQPAAPGYAGEGLL